MKDSKIQTEFDKEFRSHIERFTESVVASLKKLVNTEIPVGEFEVLSFEIQADWRYFPVRAFAMDREAVDEEYDEPPFCGKVLPNSTEPLIPPSAIDQDYYEANGVGTFERGARVLAEWFGECWHTAGGLNFPLPTYINLHDSSHYYDLHALQWVEANTIGKD